jgi:hypothetical protein
MSSSLTYPRHPGTRSSKSPWLDARVWLHRAALRRALAAGTDPSSSPELARRAEQLTSLRSRRRLAAGLNRALRAAEKPQSRLTAAVPVQSRDVLQLRAGIEQLAHELVAPGELQVRGILLVQSLLTDGNSPLFAPSANGQLDRAVRHARAALLLG